MEELQDFITHRFNQLYIKSRPTFWVSLCFAGAILIALTLIIIIGLLPAYRDTLLRELAINLLATVVGILATFLFVRLLFLWNHQDEDKNKVSYANSDMWRQYGTNYRQQFELHNSVFTVYCEPLLKKGEFKTLKVDDDPNNYFSLDTFIKAQFFTLIEAHAMSKSTNSVTVRLIDVIHQPGADNAFLRTARSTYLSHMLTNRALDYELKPGITIRSLFENTNHLVPLSRSRLSNHLGINALVFLKDTEKNSFLLLPERGNNATVAKHKVTASIATRLEMDKEHFPNTYIDKLTAPYIEEECIRVAIDKAIRLNNPPIDSIQFLGLSRDIYEGGKPTLFYVVYLNMTPDEYFQATKDYKADNTHTGTDNKLPKSIIPLEEEKIDQVETIHVVKWATLKLVGGPKQIEPEPKYYDMAYDKAQLEFTEVFELEGKSQELHKGFEQNLIANFWFLQNCS